MLKSVCVIEETIKLTTSGWEAVRLLQLGEGRVVREGLIYIS